MKEVTLKLYNFSELSEEAQERVIEDKRWDIAEIECQFVNDDYEGVVDKFAEIAGIKICDWEVSEDRYFFRLSIPTGVVLWSPYDHIEDVELEELSGKHLFRYIDNNIMPYLYKRKAYYKNKKVRQSRILKYTDCTLTGMSTDLYITGPLLEYYHDWPKRPKDYTFRDLMEECCDSFFSAWKRDLEDALKEEAVRDFLENNDSEIYREDGKETIL